MTKSECIQNIIFMPERHYNQNSSPAQLIIESGYYDFHDDIYYEDLTNALINNPQIIDYWKMYSGDQRCGKVPGIVFENGVNKVVYANAEGETKIFATQAEAVTLFIQLEIEKLRSLFHMNNIKYKKSLDNQIKRKEDYDIARPLSCINDAQGYFRSELDYLISKGYQLSQDGTKMTISQE